MYVVAGEKVSELQQTIPSAVVFSHVELIGGFRLSLLVRFGHLFSTGVRRRSRVHG